MCVPRHCWGTFFIFPNKALPPLTLRSAVKCPRSVQSSKHSSQAAPDSGVQSHPGQGKSLDRHSTLKTTTSEEKAVQGNLPGGPVGDKQGSCPLPRPHQVGEETPAVAKHQDTPAARAWTPPGAPTSTLQSSAGPAQLVRKTGRPHPARGDPGSRPRWTESSEPRLERPQLPAAAPARAPCTAAAPETAPRRGSAGGTWCRHTAPPCPARAVLATPLPPACRFIDSLRYNLLLYFFKEFFCFLLNGIYLFTFVLLHFFKGVINVSLKILYHPHKI